jgi:hypothetical protein
LKHAASPDKRIATIPPCSPHLFSKRAEESAQQAHKPFSPSSKIWAATQEQFAAVQVGKQKIGQVKAARLYSLLHSQ